MKQGSLYPDRQSGSSAMLSMLFVGYKKLERIVISLLHNAGNTTRVGPMVTIRERK